MNQPNQQSNATFYGLGIAPIILETLERMKFKIPTPIQYKAIPIGIEGKDVIGIAQTGTGKTLAFGIPMLQRLAQTSGRGLVLVPTRELALQVDEALSKLGAQLGMKTAVLIGGASMHLQIQALRRHPRLIIATPGRLIDHLNQAILRLEDVKILVLDEADRMLDMGFAPQIERIFKYLSRERQTMLFSASIPEKIVKIAASHMKLPVSVEIARSGTAAKGITQELFIIKKEEKNRKIAKDKLSAVLIETMKKNNLDEIDINNGQLQYSKKTVKKPITKTVLLNLLSTYYQGDTEKASEVNNFILENREEVVKENIIRKINKEL